jgi:hypothetical protein
LKGVRIPVRAKQFSLLDSVQSGYVAHPASYSIGTGAPYLAVLTTQLHLVLWLRMRGAAYTNCVPRIHLPKYAINCGKTIFGFSFVNNNTISRHHQFSLHKYVMAPRGWITMYVGVNTLYEKYTF